MEKWNEKATTEVHSTFKKIKFYVLDLCPQIISVKFCRPIQVLTNLEADSKGTHQISLKMQFCYI